MKRDELLGDIFGAMRALTIPCERWMAASPRFAGFIEANRGKIRKKARLAAASGPAGTTDLLRELEVAYLLLWPPQLAVEYETYAAEKVRGPDFTVTYKGHTRFNVEVKRLRPGQRAFAARVDDAVCEKLRQMPPSIANLLWLAGEDDADDLDLPAALRRLVQRAEAGDPAFLARYRFAGTREFWAGWQRLSGVLVRRAGHDGGEVATLWVNSQARHALPRELAAWLTA